MQHYPGLENVALGRGWRDGVAFCVLLHSYKPHLVDLNLMKSGDVMHNCTLAFKAGEALGARALLDPRDLRDGKEVDKRSLLTYLASLHQVLEGKSGGGRGEEGDSGVSSSSSGQASPVGVGVVRRRRGEERKQKEEGRRRVRSLCEGEGESAFLTAFRKFSSLTLSEGEMGWDGGGGEKRGFKGMEEKDNVSLKRLGGRVELKKEPQKRESVSRGCQTEDRGCQTDESHLRSQHLWKRPPLSVKFAPSPTPSTPSHPQPVQPPNPIPNPSHTSDSIFYSSLCPPAPPQKQRLSMRLARIEAVRRRQSGSHLTFNSLQSGSHSHLPFSSLPFSPPSLPYHQFSTLV